MWRINDDDFLGRLAQGVSEVSAVLLGRPARLKKAKPPSESENWLAPAREGELGPWGHKKSA
jgi:hypothetical protein